MSNFAMHLDKITNEQAGQPPFFGYIYRDELYQIPSLGRINLSRKVIAMSQ